MVIFIKLPYNDKIFIWYSHVFLHGILICLYNKIFIWYSHVGKVPSSQLLVTALIVCRYATDDS